MTAPLVPRKPLLVLCEWEDASTADDAAWIARKDAPAVKPTIFQQVGWLLELNESCVVLSSALNEDLMSARDRIPLGMVRSIHAFDVSARTRVALPAPKSARRRSKKPL